ncbi:MAG: DUF4922 domain-containing protein [Candidatus Marinimicrobia bacterium]|nr:DUF4922 domain-containing protein [Candidatus Neomarinimicrobiota bacterium]
MNLYDHHLDDSELQPFFIDKNTVDDNARAAALVRQQSDPVRGWPRYIRNLDAYSRILRDHVNVQGIDIVVTLNETRAPSVTAKTFESKCINSGPCMLCHLDIEQKGVLTLDDRYLILVNPGITIPGDLTIASVNHEPQIIVDSFDDMVSLSKMLTDYLLFFNGAMAGASSSHFHFQAGIKNTLIAERQIDRLLDGLPVGNAELVPLHKSDTGRIFFLNKYLRAVYLIESTDDQELIRLFQQFFIDLRAMNQKMIRNISNVPDFGGSIRSLNMDETEPRMNLALKYFPETSKYQLLIFPKIFNRPSVYFKKGAQQIIVGMAIKESLGNLISCRTSDYQKLLESTKLISEIYNDTSISTAMADELNQSLRTVFSF